MPAQGNVILKLFAMPLACCQNNMNIRILILGVLLAVNTAAAQRTNVHVSHFDGNSAARIGIYYQNGIVGTTDTHGYKGMSGNLWSHQITLKSGDEVLPFIVLDSSGGTKEFTKIYRLQLLPQSLESAVVRSSRNGSRGPFTISSITKDQLANRNTAQDLPILLQYMPSVTVTTDAGNGVGYTGIRVRGSDASRTNITINGVPINDAESQSTYWVNMPDLTSSVESVEIQRGAGSSVSGAGAFGANVNIQTAASFKPYGLVNQSYGSFNTRKTTLAAGTGLLNKHWTMDLRISNIASDGFIDRAATQLSSYYVSAGYFGKKGSIKIVHFAGNEKTYQAWNGIPREKAEGNDSALKNHYFRNAGTLYKTYDDSVNLFSADPNRYNYYTYRNETDNYSQKHTHIYFNTRLSKRSSLNITYYNTLGAGYFEQFKYQDKLSNYGLPNYVNSVDTFKRTDIIRRRWLDNTLNGIIANVIAEAGAWRIAGGGGYSQYYGNHFGEIVWARFAPAAGHLAHYYDAIGDKYDGNIFLKIDRDIVSGLSITADGQLRRVYHRGRGFDNDLRPVNFVGNYTFYNQKLGWVYQRNTSKFYGSAGIIHKEPSRGDFTDRPGASEPLPESMLNLELGWQRHSKNHMVSVNYYLMDYHNQLVMTGAVNDVGNPIRMNVDRSQRMGIEAEAAWRPSEHWQLAANATVSRNQIQQLVTETTDYADYSVVYDTLDRVPLSFSPSVIAAAMITWLPGRNWSITWNHKYTGKQYLDNTGNEDKVLNAFYLSECVVQKQVNLAKSQWTIKLQVQNLFNSRVYNNGYTYEYFYGKPSLTREVFLFPTATRNIMACVQLQF